MRYGFVIDQNRCIGCHACTVACKEEHNIAVGVNRTWVKYIEKGHYPDTRRHFAVLRCNHCDAAPCMEICPTVALFRRPDGIVDFDGERCIGCKSCMQACPYDALYIDPNRNTAAKCNFDASRIEMGYKPACEVVCPTQAILSGDLDEPNSYINQIIATQKVAARKPEKGTRPKLFYVGVDGDLLQPTMMEPQNGHMWAVKQPGEDLYALSDGNPERSIPGVAREVYDVPHVVPWGKKIASYLWAKSIAAGILIVAAMLLNLGFDQDAVVLELASPALALIFLGATMLLLILDLKKPGRFFYILIKPNLRSWLTLGGYVLLLYGALAVAWLFYAIREGAVPPWLFWSAAVAGIGSAGYSAFLFGQAKGRDLWQSPLLFWHLLVQAIAAGTAIFLILGSLVGVTVGLYGLLINLLAISLLLSLAMILGDVSGSHRNEEIKRATELLTRGALRKQFWILAIVLGVLVPIGLLIWAGEFVWGPTAAAVLALFGLWMYEHLWIKAGQAVPLS
jgi:Fe-S-cluster-containing dehydrogenase component/formate-dependent nitrite reductase membrane component NrfD